MMLDKQSVITASDDLTFADLDGEAVLLDEREGVYYGLNEVGNRILKLIRQPREVEEVLQVVLDEYEVEPNQLRSDVMSFIRTMQEKELISIVDRR